ncbi:MAG: hypothetical protein ACE5H0_13180 [Bacteroidota bacterium]
MADTAARIQPYQPAEPNYWEQEPVVVREGRNVVKDDLIEYAWYQDVNLPSKLPESANTSEQPTDSLTAGQANRDDQPTIENLRERLASSVITTSRAIPKQDGFVLLQKWEGIVTQVGKDSILARLSDLSEKGPDEEVELPIEEIPPSDRKLVAPGAVFYWCIGYLDTVHGQRIRASAVRFRRLPVWTKEEVRRARSEAQATRDLLGWK